MPNSQLNLKGQQREMTLAKLLELLKKTALVILAILLYLGLGLIFIPLERCTR